MLLGLSFYGASLSMRKVVKQTDRKLGPELVRAAWLESHNNIEWRIEFGDGTAIDPSADESASFYKSMLASSRTLGSQFDSYVILPQDAQINPAGKNPPTDPDEAAYLRSLATRLPDSLPDDESETAEDPLELPQGHWDREFVTADGAEKYRYYQPLYADSSCVFCHRSLGSVPMPQLVEGDLMAVVRVETDQEDTNKTLAWNNSLLITLAVVIGMLSMFLLYFIVRYVIVKPLQHLRDVANAVREGDTEQTGRHPDRRRARRPRRRVQPDAPTTAEPARRPSRT